MLNEDVLKIVLNDKTFSQREAEEIVGSRGRLFKLIGSGGIRACLLYTSDAADVLRV